MPCASLAAGTADKRYRPALTGVYRSNILGELRMDFPSQPISSYLVASSFLVSFACPFARPSIYPLLFAARIPRRLGTKSSR